MYKVFKGSKDQPSKEKIMKRILYNLDALELAPYSSSKDPNSIFKMIDHNSKILHLGPVQTRRYAELIAQWRNDPKENLKKHLETIHENKKWIP